MSKFDFVDWLKQRPNPPADYIELVRYIKELKEQNRRLRVAVQRLLDKIPEWILNEWASPVCLTCGRPECAGHDILDCAYQEAQMLLEAMTRGELPLVPRGGELGRLLAKTAPDAGGDGGAEERER